MVGVLLRFCKSRVLLRFHKSPIALVGDIKSMFSQVLVDKNDQDALQFLWFKDGNLQQQPIEYRMQSHVFQEKSLLCCATCVLQRTASDNLTGARQRITEVVVKNIYVDDLCLSCHSEQEAVDLLEQISPLLAKGSLQLTKFMSNSQQVLSQVPREDLAVQVEPSSKQLPVQKLLGVIGTLLSIA